MMMEVLPKRASVLSGVGPMECSKQLVDRLVSLTKRICMNLSIWRLMAV